MNITPPNISPTIFIIFFYTNANRYKSAHYKKQKRPFRIAPNDLNPVNQMKTIFLFSGRSLYFLTAPKVVGCGRLRWNAPDAFDLASPQVRQIGIRVYGLANSTHLILYFFAVNQCNARRAVVACVWVELYAGSGLRLHW